MAPQAEGGSGPTGDCGAPPPAGPKRTLATRLLVKTKSPKAFAFKSCTSALRTDSTPAGIITASEGTYSMPSLKRRESHHVRRREGELSNIQHWSSPDLQPLPENLRDLRVVELSNDLDRRLHIRSLHWNLWLEQQVYPRACRKRKDERERCPPVSNLACSRNPHLDRFLGTRRNFRLLTEQECPPYHRH